MQFLLLVAEDAPPLQRGGYVVSGGTIPGVHADLMKQVYHKIKLGPVARIPPCMNRARIPPG